jgi:hypothetical protein
MEDCRDGDVYVIEKQYLDDDTAEGNKEGVDGAGYAI